MTAATRHTLVSLAMLISGCNGCNASSNPSQPPAPEVRVAPPDRRTDRPELTLDGGRVQRERASIIDGGGVGEIRIGQPIPARHLPDERHALARYTIRWVADAQPFEAFRVSDPELLALFDGPFTRWAESNVGELEPGRFLSEALREARAGAPVRAILVETRGAQTREQIGVGSSWAELLDAYPRAKVTRLPEWFEPRPTCSVRPPELDGVAFHLDSCGKEPGDVIRILVSP